MSLRNLALPLLLLGLISGTCGCKSPPPAAIADSVTTSQLHWQQTVMTVTVLPDETDAVARYTFTNQGPHAVAITDIITSCDCTFGSANQESYAPGEIGSLRITFETTGYTGHIEQTITILTDEPGTRPTPLRLIVDIL